MDKLNLALWFSFRLKSFFSNETTTTPKNVAYCKSGKKWLTQKNNHLTTFIKVASFIFLFFRKGVTIFQELAGYPKKSLKSPIRSSLVILLGFVDLVTHTSFGENIFKLSFLSHSLFVFGVLAKLLVWLKCLGKSYQVRLPLQG